MPSVSHPPHAALGRTDEVKIHEQMPSLFPALSNSFWLSERMAALLCSSRLGLLSKDNDTLLLPCRDKHGLNEQERVQSVMSFFFFFLQLKQGSAHMPEEEEWPLLQAKPATASRLVLM